MRIGVVLGLLLCLLGCGKQEEPEKFVGTDVSGAVLGGDLGLTDHTGRVRQLSEFRGKVVAMFFGYTHCPDICPTTLADLAKARKLLGKQGEDLQVLFITLDPERDSEQVLQRYVPSFDPSFIGLRGDPAATKKVAQDYKIFFARQESGSRAGYTVDHSGGVYLFDKQGKLRVYLNVGHKPQDLAHDIGQLADS